MALETVDLEWFVSRAYGITLFLIAAFTVATCVRRAKARRALKRADDMMAS